jgi:NTE family protein
MTDTVKTIHLALQGGGAHGAFTWGVLDTLLADGRLRYGAISGTSAGAVNAVALAHGWARAQAEGEDPAEGARVALAHVWRKVMDMGAMSESAARVARLVMGALPSAFSRMSPYQSNPMDYNPLRELITGAIDFDRIARLKSPRVFVAATDVETGRAAIFSGKRLTAQAVMASACLPQLFQAPEINGKQYWDGGFASNPALGPLVEADDSQDILLVQINPLRRTEKPTTLAEINDRVNDLTFNASLISQMRTIALVNDMVASGLARPGLKPIYMHRIDGGKALAAMPAASKLAPKPATLEQLFAMGQESATRWLRKHFDAVGERGTIDLRRDYGDPLKLDFEQPDEAAAAPSSEPHGSSEALTEAARFSWSLEAQTEAARQADAAANAAASAHDGDANEVPPEPQRAAGHTA